MVSINEAVMPLVRQLVDSAEALKIGIRTFPCGATVIDTGLEVEGSMEASRIQAEIMMGGLGEIAIKDDRLGDHDCFSLDVSAEQVEISCIASQIAGWKVPTPHEMAIGSGPARALAAAEDDHCIGNTSYRDSSELAVVTLQCEYDIDDSVALYCAEACGVAPDQMYILIHPTTSLAASVQVSARIIEQSINKMMLCGFDTSVIRTASGSCLIAPVSPDFDTAMGRINDALLYGGTSCFTVDTEDEEIERLLEGMVTSTHPYSGRLFKDIFVEADRSFYNIDNQVHCPAATEIFNERTGNTFTAGEIREDLLIRSFYS